jgi:cysteine desulfurase / selenocysteine lyase
MSLNPARHDYQRLFVGLDVEVPLIDGTHTRYINFDNAASTPPVKAVQKAVDDFMVFYSSVHRGTGFKSQLSTYYYEYSRHKVLSFFGANPTFHTCAFSKNTTESINKLARRFPFTPEKNVVLTSSMEHHSNDLPWRAAADTVHIASLPDGRLDEADFDRKLTQYGSRVALVAVTGASNVTGYINSIHRLAAKTHAAGAMILADCAQLAPHRAVNMGDPSDPERLDFIVISAHKMYAPFGTGALIGPRQVFEQGNPDLSGGGTVEIVTIDDVIWADPPDKEEAGSPNTIGAVALAAAICQLEAVGMQAVAEHEALLTEYALQRLAHVPGITIFGDTNPATARSRLGVIPLGFQHVPHFLAAAVLGYEFGIGVRSGCFCAHPYILHLLGLSPDEANQVRETMLAGDRSKMPGLIRASFGLYNTIDEIDALVEALEKISRQEYTGQYSQEISTGEYTPLDWQPNFEDYFKINALD